MMISSFTYFFTCTNKNNLPHTNIFYTKLIVMIRIVILKVKRQILTQATHFLKSGYFQCCKGKILYRLLQLGYQYN